MKTAHLYLRVSTDEQAEKGFSLRHQNEQLVNYCKTFGISIQKIYTEDYSAKTFNRPEWKKLLLQVKKNKGKTDLLLFTKWDRFSRNASDAYQMISSLNKCGISPQAIEQPLDLSVPENKLILAIYLTTPEVENDRRGMNTQVGIRRAKKEGRWTSKAPLGYINKCRENGHKYIDLHEPDASIMKWVFHELEKGVFSGETILQEARLKGLVCSKNNFYNCIRHPMYCGKIVVPKFKDEQAMLVQGQHEPLISETCYYNVQEILDSRTKVYGLPKTTPKEFPLRGFLRCPRCTRMLTASGSKGQRGYYHKYYHCTSKCGFRLRANETNQNFEVELFNYVPKNGVEELVREAIEDCYKNQVGSILDERKEYMDKISESNKRLGKARDLLLNGDIDGSDFQEVKTECNKNVEILEARLNDLVNQNYAVLDIRPILHKALENLKRLDIFFEKSCVEAQRVLIGTIFKEKMDYENGKYRTSLVNEIAGFIYLKNKELELKKKGQKPFKKSLPHNGWNMGLEPTTLGTTNRCSNQLS